VLALSVCVFTMTALLLSGAVSKRM